jgi:hypothetical protein
MTTIATLLGLDSDGECPHAFSLWWDCKICRRTLDEKIAALESLNTPLREVLAVVQSALQGKHADGKPNVHGDHGGCPHYCGSWCEACIEPARAAIRAILGEPTPPAPAVTGTTSDPEELNTRLQRELELAREQKREANADCITLLGERDAALVANTPLKEERDNCRKIVEQLARQVNAAEDAAHLVLRAFGRTEGTVQSWTGQQGHALNALELFWRSLALSAPGSDNVPFRQPDDPATDDARRGSEFGPSTSTSSHTLPWYGSAALRATSWNALDAWVTRAHTEEPCRDMQRTSVSSSGGRSTRSGSPAGAANTDSARTAETKAERGKRLRALCSSTTREGLQSLRRWRGQGCWGRHRRTRGTVPEVIAKDPRRGVREEGSYRSESVHHRPLAGPCGNHVEGMGGRQA